MSEVIDYDPRIAAELDATLRAYPLSRRLTARPRGRPLRVIVATAAAVVVSAGVGVGFEVNVVAESQGAGCLDALAKINLFGRALAESVHNGTTDEQRGAKDRLMEYARPLIAANCADRPDLLIKTNNGTNPLPSPSGAVPSTAPYNGPIKGGPKPTNPPPSPSPKP